MIKVIKQRHIINDVQTIVVRDYSSKDFKDVAEIDKEVFNAKNPAYDIYIYLTYGKDILVADIGGKIVGYIVTMDLDQRSGKIISFAVSEKFRNRGIGSRLLKSAIERLKSYGKSQIALEVRVSNKVAQNLYKKFGFKISGIIPEYYSDGEDAYYMVLDLGDQ
ncbi:MAG: ribosomal protein S18-alanine N-acetyltransferase [Archaeoglobales archaeon]|nr:ribosomal protein S18-alanine N-acetyltransferase [Archaeoglobales archaeon]